ncbi:hypothetical protein AJ80_05767 [Polytolypa hystricis UAMH7299]|uniref:Geranylgeranyl transferase type-1 subunit beta n=1 Tax=Polytolypa hystricis (strain UAMH7299) TaxID=1447883 RepID=A0A2B7Y1C3_POLH7|nr:hypothetical protein AJ80_05767 [Polytolypa hystricis UAMH7299]
MQADTSPLRKDRQVKYFLRCLKTFLPQPYTANDSSRMTLGFFIIAGLDLLDVLDTKLSPAERQGYIDWIYHCQVPSGGFRGFTGTHFGNERRTDENECWDPANVPATFFALAILLILGDDLSRVERKGSLNWLRSVQRQDGSFGEVLGTEGKVEGGRDLRFCCCAAGVRYILRGKDTEYLKDIQDIDVDGLVSYIDSCQTYDGGFAQAPLNESHAGLTYCAVATLSFLGRTPPALHPGTTRFEELVQWLSYRQTTQLEEDDDDDDDSQETSADSQESSRLLTPQTPPELSVDDTISALADLQLASERPLEELNWAGFNGRVNKIADTCYCFWVTGALSMLDRLNVIDSTASRRFLLEKTQHVIGGFGKGAGEIPDVLHSYLGLVSLSLTGETELEDVDAMFCTSKKARRHLESLSWWMGNVSE